ncbi:MobF family relaxase [Pseudonocardia alni]|uniref:MobF family relaxase n=1 Tax=Pseudonocardia alni TaxID=33907 RepID=UPI0027DC7E3C|nr:MobF family relaxase [Pseudonocardia alni]
MLRIVNGYSPEYLLKEVATGRENYYTGAVAEGEPPGRWWGAGAEKLGLHGLVEAQDMRAVYERFLDPRDTAFGDPSQWDTAGTLGHTGRKYLSEDQIYAAALGHEPDASPERRAQLRTEAGQKARHNVAFYDATFSVQKSVTLLHTAFEAREVAARQAGDEDTAAAWGEFRTAVEDAIWAGNNAALELLQDKAGYTRVGRHGGAAGRYADAHEFTVASFFQHDSRDRDPQLHIHNTILNRVEGPDGIWRTVDGRSLHRWRPAAAAVAERTTEERITASLGLMMATRPDGKAREVVGVSEQAMSLISTRRHKVTAKTAELVEAFETRYGHAPNGYQLERLAQQATLATRARKSHHGETREDLLDRVAARMDAEIAGGLAGIADAALAARPGEVAPMQWSPAEVVSVALAEVQNSRTVWARPDLIRALNSALPDHLGVSDGGQIAKLLDILADEAMTTDLTSVQTKRPAADVLPDEYKLANGDSAFEAPGATLYATTGHVHTERILAGAAGRHDGERLPDAAIDRFLTGLAVEGTRLGAAQEAAVRGVLGSGSRVETLVGPPGTGKSFTVGMMARAWTDPDLTGGPERRVFGLATAQAATTVLAEQGLTARNIAAWLATQDRLTAGRPRDDTDLGFRLHAGDIVVVDESAMTDTPALAAIHGHVDAAGAKLLLVGDPRQLAAIGAGGGMDLIARAGGARYELNEARRFTHVWEREASLRLREGDTTVLEEYHRQGRLIDCGDVTAAETAAARAWLADTLNGTPSLLLVDTNEQADRLSSELRAQLVDLGLVAESGVRLGRTGAYAGVGDVVEARAIGHDLAGYEGNTRAPHTRERFRVLGVRDDGGLDVTTDLTRAGNEVSVGERMVLSPRFVADDLALGYAGTRYCGQGATVTTCHSVVTDRTDHAAALVGLTRGTDANTAYVATVTELPDAADGSRDHQLHRSPKAVLTTALELAEPDRSALTVAEESARWAESVPVAAELFADAAHQASVRRTTAWLDRLTDTGVLTVEQRDQLAAEDASASLTRPLRRAEVSGADPYAVLRETIAGQPLSGARNLTNVIHARMRDRQRFEPQVGTWADRIPELDDPQMARYLDRLAVHLDQRTADLGAQTAAEPPRWATDLLGEVPDRDDAEARAEWERKAGAVAACRALTGRDDTDDADSGPAEALDVLGVAPKPGMAEHHAAYCAGWEALGRPRADREEFELSDGALRMRVRAYERQHAWAPRYVANELAGTRQAAEHHRGAATLHRAEADAATDPARAAELRQAADGAAALAAELDRRTGELEEVEAARGRWLLRTAVDRDKHDRAVIALAHRNSDRDAPDERVTADEWLTAHDEAMRAEDQHRSITEHDLDDGPVDEHQALDDGPVLETAVPDLRETAATEPRERHEDDVRVPSTAESEDAVTRARRALDEIQAQEVYEADLDTPEARDVDYAREDLYADEFGDGEDDYANRWG